MKERASGSDVHAMRVVEAEARFQPEIFSQFGHAAVDANVSQLPPDGAEQQIAAYRELLADLRKHRKKTNDPDLGTDLDVLIAECERESGHRRIEAELLLPYCDLPQLIYLGFRTLLHDKVAPDRRPAARVRLGRYTGDEPGYAAITRQFQTLVRSRLREPGLLPPCAATVDRHLATSPTYYKAIGKLLEEYEIPGHETLYAELCAQGRDWDAFVREVIRPRARADFRLPPELYASHLRYHGVDMPAAELLSRARAEVRNVRREMQALAQRLAGNEPTVKKSSPFVDYRAVLRRFGEQDPIPGDKILSHYRSRFREFRRLIERHDVLTLPRSAPRLVPATAADGAVMPFPHTIFPRVLAGGDDPVEIVLPLVRPPQGGEPSGLHVATSAASSWCLSVHEGAHALHFSAVAEACLPLARILFSTLTDCEGWAIYLETEVGSHLPAAAQPIFLRMQLGRAVRTYLEASLQQGTMSAAEAARIFREDLGLPEATAEEELARFHLAPGQAATYFCGATRANELRAEIELLLGLGFRRRDYHDRILAQGLMPFALLRRRVIEELIPRSGQKLAA